MQKRRTKRQSALSKRKKQPGHDRSFTKSERNFSKAAKSSLNPSQYRVVDKPKDLLKVFRGKAGDFGVQPEVMIENIETGRKFFVEVKKQGPRGNAWERACKHHTAEFQKLLRRKYHYKYHPFVTVLCENLAEDPHYTVKAKFLFESDNYFLWTNYEISSLKKYLKKRCRQWLD